MKRLPILKGPLTGKMPKCFGNPSLVDEGCLACKVRPGCCNTFSKGKRIRVLSVPHRENVLSNTEVQEIGGVGGGGLDVILWQSVHTLLRDKYLCTLRPKQSPYAVSYVNAKKRMVIGVRRIDVRGVEIDFVYAASALDELGARAVRVGGKRRWRIRLNPDVHEIREAVEKVLDASAHKLFPQP